MTIRRRNAALAAGIGLVLMVTAVGVTSLVRQASAARAADTSAARLSIALSEVDAALARGDVSRALMAWHAAYVTVLYDHRWDGLVEAGDAWLRIERASGSPKIGAARARELYLSALFRARQQASVEGVLRAAAAFDALGDRDVAVRAIQIASSLEQRRLASEGGDPIF